MNQDNKVLKNTIKILKEELKTYKEGFLFQDKVLTQIGIPKQEEKLIQALVNPIKQKDLENWLLSFKPLQIEFETIHTILNQFINSHITLDIVNTLEIQKNIQKNLDSKEFTEQDKENLKQLIFILSLIYGTLVAHSENDIPFIKDNV